MAPQAAAAAVLYVTNKGGHAACKRGHVSAID